tara:strand:+ start:1299 stop:1712 length:414 start_codon:yes stop_codon:yes gene_type:complete
MEQLDLFGELKVQIKEGEKTRVCTKCNIEKPLPMFKEQTNGMIKKNGKEYNRHHSCMDCMKKSDRDRAALSKKYKCNQTHCDCCGKETKKLHLDHDHHTAEFRGWLCIQCNQGIGKLGDNIEGVTNALNFLKKHYEK